MTLKRDLFQATASFIVIVTMLSPWASLTLAQSRDVQSSASREPSPTLDDIVKSQVGSVARASVYRWRQKSVLISLTAGQLVEMNAFESTKYAIVMRFPGETVTMQLGLARILVANTDATRELAATPYRQAGRPSRFEADFGLETPLSEGVANQLFEFYPLGQMVVSAQARLRYLVYPEVAKSKGGAREVMQSWFATALSDDDVEALSRNTPKAMAIDRGRLNLLGGLRFEHFASSGLAFHADLLLAAPISDSNNAKGLGAWWEMTGGVGFGF